jgi:hypothetical protein
MIKLNVDQFNEELRRFNAAIADFRPYSDSFIKSCTGTLDKGFNSDFIDGFKGLLDSLKDTKAPKLLEKAEKLYAAAQKTAEGIEKVDHELADNFNKGK